MVRESNIIRILGEENFNKLRSTKCLLVGAGGIGCELLKDLLLMEFGEIHIVDLDTIDLSNLNRQFLFRQRDIKQPKSTTAAKAVQHFNNSKLIPYQGNIMDAAQFPLCWFEQFDIIFNALDNLGARRYVNKMSQFLSTPLLESGTAGFDGYIQPIIPGRTECFDCTKKETPKTFPVCTIRSTPSQPIHCIVWAKNFLFNQLFAADTESNTEENKDWGTTDEEEIMRIKQESNELQELQDIIVNQNTDKIPDILKKLFVYDIEKLLLIENLWKTRAKPKPLPLESYDLHPNEEKLNDSNIWPIEKQVQQFVNVTSRLMKRMPQEENHIEFDKDDKDTLEFVAVAANIRSYIFDIPVKSVFDIKQIAGNIIPAIATTNAIIAGLSSLVSLRVLNLLKYAPLKSATDLNMAFTAKASNLSQNRYLSNPQLAPPNCKCAVCSKVIRAVIRISESRAASLTLEELISNLRTKYHYGEDISLLDVKDQRLLVDYDFEDLLEKTLGSVSLGNGSILLFTDEDEDEEGMCRQPLEIYLDISDECKSLDLKLPDIEIPLIKATSSAENEPVDKDEDAKLEPDAGTSGEIVILIDEEEGNDDTEGSKRKLSNENTPNENPSKKVKQDIDIEGDEDIIELD